MADKCSLHPGRASAGKMFGNAFCALCLKHIAVAQKAVTADIAPSPCFVTYKGKDDWDAIGGTGCAHWMSHQLNITKGGADLCCMEGFTFRVKTAIAGRRVIAVVDKGAVTSGDIAKVAKGHIYATLDEKHCGIVRAVVAAKKGADPDGLPKITIENDSSKQGGVRKNGFADYFKATGKFLA